MPVEAVWGWNIVAWDQLADIYRIKERKEGKSFPKLYKEENTSYAILVLGISNQQKMHPRLRLAAKAQMGTHPLEAVRKVRNRKYLTARQSMKHCRMCGNL